MSKKSECSYIPVHATESDLLDYVTLSIAKELGLIKEERYKLLSRSTIEDIKGGGGVDGVSLLLAEEKADILEKLFGFCGGNYEEELIEGQQKSRYNRLVSNENRYTGVERMDKEWCEGGMASSQVKEVRKWGQLL